jgi:hypothetical protein
VPVQHVRPSHNATAPKFLVDAGYRGLANDHHEQVIAPPLKPNAPPDETAAYETARKSQSSQRIPAEHAIAAIKWWRTLQRFTGRPTRGHPRRCGPGQRPRRSR